MFQVTSHNAAYSNMICRSRNSCNQTAASAHDQLNIHTSLRRFHQFLNNPFICPLLSARELLGCVMCGLEEDGEPIPAPSALSAIQPKENERVVLVDAYMPSVRLASINRSVNRTVTLPAWLNAAALERNVNFSQVLQDALKHQLHLA